MRLLRLNDLKAKTGLSRSTIYELITKGMFPPPIKLGPKVSMWPENEVDIIISAWISGASEDEIRKLVKEIRQNRSSKKPGLAGVS